MMATHSRTLDILVVGAGQAGLALGYYLKTAPFTFQIVDCHGRIGDSWRKRYDSVLLCPDGPLRAVDHRRGAAGRPVASSRRNCCMGRSRSTIDGGSSCV